MVYGFSASLQFLESVIDQAVKMDVSKVPTEISPNCEMEPKQVVKSNHTINKPEKEAKCQEVKTKNVTKVEPESEALLKIESLDVVNSLVSKSSNFSRSSTFAEDAKSAKTKPEKKFVRNLESQSTSRANSLKQADSRSSLAQSTTSSKGQVLDKKLPHPLGSIPRYLRKNKPQADVLRPQTVGVPVTSSTTKLMRFPSQADSVNLDVKEDGLKQIENQITKNKLLEMKLQEAKLKIAVLSGKVDSLNKSLEDAKKELNEKTLHLNEKIEKESVAVNKTAKVQRDAKKANEKTKELEDQLKTRDAEMTALRKKASSSVEEIESLKKQITEGTKTKQKSANAECEQLKRDICDLKNSEKQLKQEVLTLTSKLDDEKNTNIRIENLLELRGEYVKTLQDTDEINKARLVLQVKEVEDLREKVAKARKFKAATNEELSNLFNTLKSQEFQISQLQQDLKHKDEKLCNYKKMCSAGDH